MGDKLIRTKLIFSISLFLAYLFFAFSCAQISQPTGGPKDTIAPKILRTVPENYSLDFKRKVISVEFDEYVSLKNINQKFVISPPLKEKPEVSTKGKKMIVELNNILKDSTTYTLSFSDAIQDFNENNPLLNYEFVVSTGKNIDTLQIKGRLLNALDHKPIEEANVMLYENHDDSLPLKKIPDFYAKTNKRGAFAIKNIKPATYKVFAIKENNKNFLFDSPMEEIAFMDSFIVPSAKTIEKIDTLQVIQPDSTKKDSIVVHRVTEFYPDTVQIYLFQEDYQKQYMADNKRNGREICKFIFNKSLSKNLEIQPINYSPPKTWHLFERNLNNDTLTYWLTDSLLIKRDTLAFQIKYEKTDSVGKPYLYTDTIKFRYNQPKIDDSKKSKEKKKPENESKDTIKIVKRLQLQSNLDRSKTLNLGGDLYFEFEHPLFKIDTLKINLIEIQTDSSKVKKNFKLITDTLNIRKYFLHTDWKPGLEYILSMDRDAFHGIYNLSSDSIGHKFSVANEEDYGKFTLTLKGLKKRAVIYVMVDKEQIVRQYIVEKDYKLDVNYLLPATYKLKLFYDDNGNKKWDTGKYLKHLQPEKVIYYKEDIKVVSKFESEIDWEIDE